METDSDFLKRHSIFPKINISIIINLLKANFDLHIPDQKMASILKETLVCLLVIFVLFQEVELPLCDSDNNYAENSFPVHAIVIDASTFNFIDTQAVSTLLQVRW